MTKRPFKFSPAAKKQILEDVVWSISSDTSGGFDLNAEDRVSQIEKIVEEDLSKVLPKTPCCGQDRDGRTCGNTATDLVYDKFYCWVHNPYVVEQRLKRKT